MYVTYVLRSKCKANKGSVARFSTSIFSLFEPIWPPDNLLKHFCNRLVSISPRYLILKIKFLTKTIYLKNFWVRNCILKIIKICSPMMDVFTHRRILLSCSLKSIQRPANFSIPTQRCGFWLRGLHFAFCGVHFDSAVYMRPRSMPLTCHIHTAESASDVPHSHRGVRL